MSQERSEQNREVAAQREVARIALAAVDGFALAGSGAIREHGVIERPTEDVDLFTDSQDVTAFSVAVDQVTDQLRGSGFQVEQTRRAPQFARLHVATSDGLHLDIDLGVDWRQEDPVQLDVGPVLSLADAVGSKVGALYSRGEARDYLDLDASTVGFALARVTCEVRVEPYVPVVDIEERRRRKCELSRCRPP